MDDLENIKGVFPGRRDPYRIVFSAPKIEKEKRKKIKFGVKEKVIRGWRYRREGFLPNPLVHEEEEAIYGSPDYENEWRKEAAAYNRKRHPVSKHPWKRLLKPSKRKWEKLKKLREQIRSRKRYIPDYENEYSEENFNPNDYAEQRYRPGFEGGFGYPKQGIYGHFGESAPDFRSGFQGHESQSPFGSGGA